MITERQIKELTEELFAGTEFFLVEVQLRTGNRITIFIDGDNHVSIDECRRLSQFLEERLDREKEDFDLTVSSAGLDRPFSLPRQFRKKTGREIDLTTKAGINMTGTIQSADETGFELLPPQPKKLKAGQEILPVRLSFEEIKTAKEIISFKK